MKYTFTLMYGKRTSLSFVLTFLRVGNICFYRFGHNLMAFHWHECVRQVCHANDAIQYLHTQHRFYAQNNDIKDKSIN